ncbi:MAG: Peptidase M23 [Candidatus Azambacteria bacterium GW2011_GWA2_42_9]|uniref:Peptidase M23 n=3 Tax=Candidatus Azamiibacteriota TaxID=1752741 RepID=A0A0G0ZB28_9BACT|nr:MAG: Peptidase M23 [Candidatus Azambacteria bacterium GW2011_GWB1_42_17]KKS45920.1 MAG: Peptidase M23 [Candidatus Azambacteria bacterium GW2011_GWA1_42_19]KKS75015.1 MAG: Peptidase M23 [Candidatus Azambacteria bacterium GW2011_GWA2_42_9]KKS88641.1 MAG: Peptidase M23B [Parcubacteria group bacterium GW2011_GWC1_43_11]
MKKIIFLLILFLPVLVFADERDDKIRQLEASIEQYNQQIQKKQSEAQNLANQISIFELQIKQSQAEIDATNLTIKQLASAIGGKEAGIAQKEKEIKEQNILLAQYLRQVAYSDGSSLLGFLLKNDKFSDFFNDFNSLNNVQSKIQETLETIKELKEKLIKEKEDLEDDKAEQEQLKRIQNKQKAVLQGAKKDKQKLLEETKGQEKIYQQLIAKTRADIEVIKNQPYNLAMGFKMTFEEALSRALPASQRTSVRSAFLMAILKIESDWGGNVGKGTWQTDMHPRDFNAFKKITGALGLNPDSTPVSKKPYYGWGGAMGPAQFLPTTWLLYEAAIANLTGHRPPSPWNIEDAFTASGIMLAESGADKQTYAAESKAAKIYIAGGRWNRSLTARIYANNVMAEAARIQKNIDILNQSK